MPARVGWKEYLKAAFSARPLGMFVSPNWVGVGGFLLLGLVHPGFWLMGAGLELGYVYSMVASARFRRFVNAQEALKGQSQWRRRLQEIIARLSPSDQDQYRTLEGRCGVILHQQETEGLAAGVAAQSEGLSRLLWIFLRLLMTRDSIRRVLAESGRGDRDKRTVEERLGDLKHKLENEKIGDELRKSLTSQVEILQQRMESQDQARQKLVFVEAELTRIREQVELIREQAALATDPAAVSQRIDAVASTLGDTTQWIREQQQMYGRVEDLLNEPPPIAVAAPPPLQEEKQ